MFELFEHTADLGLRVRAGDLKGLFAEAGKALIAVILENPESLRARVSVDVELHANNLEDLLFDWLSELLYRVDARRMVFCDFDVRLEGTTLYARVGGESVDPERHRFLREVKAITYHGLRVQQEQDGWMAEVIVDI